VARRNKAAERGLTLIETITALALLTIVMVGLYTLLEASNRVTKQETSVAETQQSARVGIYELGHVIRQARGGSLYYGNAVLPVENNSPGGQSLTDLDGKPHYIRKGTDVVAVRGILFDDRYAIDSGDVSCVGSCATSSAARVTIRSKANTGWVNFPNGGSPSIASRTRPFYFLVTASTQQLVTVGSSSHLVPFYYVGRVDTAGTWYTKTADAFAFSMDVQDAGARRFDTPAPTPTNMDKPFAGGVVDEVRFFLDEGPTDGSTSAADTHPSLAEAVLDAQTNHYDVRPLVADVEDFQVAYGVDGVGGLPRDYGISPGAVDQTGLNKDEWVGNVSSEVETTLTISSTDPKSVEAFLDPSVQGGSSNLKPAKAALRSVWVSLVAKSAEPDMRYDGPGARGMKTLDSSAVSFSDASATGRPFRRRLQSFAVSLRNYQ
jgi:prepilin-type N-terminal cleavage/methylation domain-containing protein